MHAAVFIHHGFKHNHFQSDIPKDVLSLKFPCPLSLFITRYSCSFTCHQKYPFSQTLSSHLTLSLPYFLLTSFTKE